MEELDRVTREATAVIDVIYFHLPVDGGDPVYRERVYCYELISSDEVDLRSVLPAAHRKSGSPVFRACGKPEIRKEGTLRWHGA